MLDNFLEILIIILIITISIKGIKRNAHNNNIGEIQNNLNLLRGIVAIFIIIGHCIMSYNSKIPIYLIPLSKLNTIFVGYFWVMSGYGLAWSVENKEKYITYKQLIQKILYLCVTAFCVLTFSLVISGIEDIVIKTGVWNSGVNWYLIVQSIFYICFFVTYKYFKDTKKAVVCVSAEILLFTIIALKFHFNIL